MSEFKLGQLVQVTVAGIDEAVGAELIDKIGTVVHIHQPVRVAGIVRMPDFDVNVKFAHIPGDEFAFGDNELKEVTGHQIQSWLTAEKRFLHQPVTIMSGAGKNRKKFTMTLAEVAQQLLSTPK